MPTRTLVTRYEDDLALFPSVYHRIAPRLTALASRSSTRSDRDHALAVGNDALIAVVGASA